MIDHAAFPLILTNAEAVAFLRLDTDHAEAADAIRALHGLVRAGRIRPIRGCGRSFKYARAELERFIVDETNANQLSEVVEAKP